jgi:Mad3/BUB1 homology region 1
VHKLSLRGFMHACAAVRLQDDSCDFGEAACASRALINRLVEAAYASRALINRLVERLDPAMLLLEDADDPLAGWIVQLQNLQHEPEALLPKLKRVCTMYQSEKRYRNDDRYVRLWIAFADSTGTPCKIFERMHSRSIGAKLALFWVAWSCVAHTAGDREEAHRLLREGRDSSAQPLIMLQEMMQDLDLGQLSPAPRHQHSDTTAAGSKRPREAAARDATAAAAAAAAEASHTQAAAAAAANVSESDCSVTAAAAVAQVTASTVVRKQPLAHRDHNQRVEQPQEKARKAAPPATASEPPLQQQQQQQQPQPKRRKKPAAVLAPVRTAKRQPGAANDSPDCAETAAATATTAAAAAAAVHPYREPHRTASTVQSPAYLAWEAQHRGVVLHDLSSSSSSSSSNSSSSGGQTLRKWPKKMATLRPYTSVQYTAAGTGVAGSGSSSSVEAKLGSRTVRVEGVLGEGAYAVVYRCKLRSGDEKHCAVKVRVCIISVILLCSCTAAAQAKAFDQADCCVDRSALVALDYYDKSMRADEPVA